jgi:hypothetical protein
MTLCEKGRPKFPDIEAEPGLYRLTLDSGWLYFGEAKDLRARLDCYVPGNTGLAQETRLHVALRDACGANVAVLTGSGLETKTGRCAIESVAVNQAKSAGLKVLNGAQSHDPYCIQLDIKFHEKQIEILRSRLQNSELKGASKNA